MDNEQINLAAEILRERSRRLTTTAPLQFLITTFLSDAAIILQPNAISIPWSDVESITVRKVNDLVVRANQQDYAICLYSGSSDHRKFDVPGVLRFLNKLIDLASEHGIDVKEIADLREKFRDANITRFRPFSYSTFVFAFLMLPLFIAVLFPMKPLIGLVQKNPDHLWICFVYAFIVTALGSVYAIWVFRRIPRISKRFLDENAPNVYERLERPDPVFQERYRREKIEKRERTATERHERLKNNSELLSLLQSIPRQFDESAWSRLRCSQDIINALGMLVIGTALFSGLACFLFRPPMLRHFLFFAWQDVGHGTIEKIEPGKWKSCYAMKPYPESVDAECGCNEVSFSWTAPGGIQRTAVEHLSPSIAFQVGQQVPVQQFAGRSDFLRIKPPLFQWSRPPSGNFINIAGFFFFFLFSFAMFLLLWWEAGRLRRFRAKILETGIAVPGKVIRQGFGVYVQIRNKDKKKDANTILIQNTQAELGTSVIVLYDPNDAGKTRYGMLFDKLPNGIVFDKERGIFFSQDIDVARWFPPVLLGIYVVEVIFFAGLIYWICF